MGIRFDLNSTAVIAYLTSHGDAKPPRLTFDQVEGFLHRLTEDSDPARPRVISSSPEWVDDMRRAACESLDHLRRHRSAEGASRSAIVDQETLSIVLDPLARTLSSYDVYILPVGTWQDSDVLDRFAHEAARMPGILVLIPDFYQPDENIRALDPSPGSIDAIKSRRAWPGAIFMLRSGEAKFVPIEEARRRVRELAEIMHDYDGDQWRLAQVLTRPSTSLDRQVPRRLLHLSDLHLGTDRAAKTEVYVQTELKKRGKMDRIVITGDLCDQPMRRHAQHYQNFSTYLRLLSENKKTPIAIPGNHDQRIFGNKLFGIGTRLRHLVDLRWEDVVVDEQSQMVFLCFDSSRTGQLARGEITKKQMLKVAREYEVNNSRGELNDFLKITLIHHHPYPYQAEREVPIIDPRGWPGREEFIELREAKGFLTWCAARDVGLILHGHKHIPRLIVDHIEDESPDQFVYHRLTTVGCGSSLGANGSPMSFNIVEWDPGANSWNVEFVIDRGDGSGFRTEALEAQVIL